MHNCRVGGSVLVWVQCDHLKQLQDLGSGAPSVQSLPRGKITVIVIGYTTFLFHNPLTYWELICVTPDNKVCQVRTTVATLERMCIGPQPIRAL